MILLKNGTIYDGTGKPAFGGSIVVDGGTIREIEAGAAVPDTVGAEVVDCTGLCVTPGFIDAHSHNDFFAAQDENLPYFEPFIRQGVTTMITGNCGFSAAGYQPGTPWGNEIGGGLFSNRGKDFSSFRDWSVLAGKQSPVNIVSLVGHGTARISLNSMSSSPLDAGRMRRMEELLDLSLIEGAAGVSFGLMYEPGRFAPREELEAVARVVKRHGKILSYHSRAMSKISTSYSPPIGGRAHGLRALDEVLEIAEKTGARTQLSHLIFVGEKSWACVDESLELLENAVKRGIDIMFDMYAMDFGASIITVVLPPWYLALPKKKRNAVFAKARLAAETTVTRKLLGFDFCDILIANTHGLAPGLEGKRVSELASDWGVGGLDAYLRAVEMTDARAEVFMFKYANPDIIGRLRTHPLSMYMTDAWITGQGIQNYAAYYNFPKFLLLAGKAGTPLETAVRKMTGAAAERYGMKGRGILAKGNRADITVFNPATLGYEEHAQKAPTGIDHVMINGRFAVRNGVFDPKAAAGAGAFIGV